MIKRILIFAICLIMANFISFKKEITNSYIELENIEDKIKLYGLKYEEGNEVIVIFDYENINNYIEENHQNINIERISEKEFKIIKSIKKGVFYKEINEVFYIRKGDNYDGWSRSFID